MSAHMNTYSHPSFAGIGAALNAKGSSQPKAVRTKSSLGKSIFFAKTACNTSPDIIFNKEQRLKLTRTQEKCADLKSLGYTNQEISSRLNIHIKTVEFHMANIKARQTTTQTKAVPVAIARHQWYLMPSKRLAQVVSVSEDMETITVEIHVRGTFKRTLGETNQADFTRQFVKANWKLWDASKGRVAQ